MASELYICAGVEVADFHPPALSAPQPYLVSLAAGLGLEIDHMGVVTAFLNPGVDDPDLFMEIPEGWDSGDVSEST